MRKLLSHLALQKCSPYCTEYACAFCKTICNTILCISLTLNRGIQVKLTNVARASQDELLEDYRDFLRVRDLPIWEKDSKEALFVRNISSKPHTTFEAYRPFVETRPAEIVANIAICLINQTNYLLDKQIRRLEQDFLNDGGLRERMSKARIQTRAEIQREHF